jgi:S-adenosylmethionine:tRNA ribosyltransferase-isomerase
MCRNRINPCRFSMQKKDFTFQLPAELIAQEPAIPRDSCRLMVLDRKDESFRHLHFADLLGLLSPGDVLVMNNSKVLPARFIFQFNGKWVELLLIRSYDDGVWIAIGKPGKILQPGTIFFIAPDFSFEVLDVLPDGRRKIVFNGKSENIESGIQKYGKTPLPPYIKRSSSSPGDYQTVFAKHNGSVAAPTAGLHFTEHLINDLRKKGIKIIFVTLHVGLGTFLPIKTDQVELHAMHGELYELNADAADELQTARKEHRRIIAVGTTSVRVLESCFDPDFGFVPKLGETSIYIYPGYKWKCVDGLITNFHLPESTLLLLTCSFGGTDFILNAYQEAVHQRYRFYSFGDAMFIS